MDSSILELIQRLAKLHVQSVIGDDLNVRFPVYGKKPVDHVKLMKKLTTKIYQILLTHKSDNNYSDMTEFDKLYAMGYEFCVQDRVKDFHRLRSLTHALSKAESSNANLRCAISLLLNLKQESNDNSRYNSTLSSKCVESDCVRQHMFKPCSVLDRIDNWSAPQWVSCDDALDTKVFSLTPGFSSASSRLKCCRAGLDELQENSSPLFGALIRPTVDSLKITVKLEIPDLSDDPNGAETWNLWSIKNWSDKRRRIEQTEEALVPSVEKKFGQSDSGSDEGFQETDTPTSAASFGRLLTNGSIWDVALTDENLKTHATNQRTWESLQCLEPVCEKPLLTETGPEALDHVIASQQQELSILFPDVASAFSVIKKCSPSEIMRHSLYVLLGMCSHTYPYDEKNSSFWVSPVSISGLSPECLHNQLTEFASSGTDHLRLERLIMTLVSRPDCGLITRAIIQGLRSYLYHRQVVINDIFGEYITLQRLEQDKIKLIHLAENTSKLRRQTRYLAELCMVTDSCNSTLPSGMSLLAYLYKACIDASCDPDTFPVVLSLLLRTTEPYIDFLRRWAFEGNCKDDHSEFPIKVDWELVTSDSENIWNKGFILEEVNDPILDKSLVDVFICGKSLSLLKFCHPSHPLCRANRDLPSLGLVFTEMELKCAENQINDYVAGIKGDAQTQNSSLVPKVKDELLRLNGIRDKDNKPQCNPVTKMDENIAKVAAVDDETNPDTVQLIENGDNADSDVNANLVNTDLENQDVNANVAHLLNLDIASKRTLSLDVAKGTKRKQDRDSIDFDVLEARRLKLRDEVGVLVEGNTNQVLRTRGRNYHGHASDSTIQNLLYGPSYLNQQTNIDQNANIQAVFGGTTPSKSMKNSLSEFPRTLSTAVTDLTKTAEQTPRRQSSTSDAVYQQSRIPMDKNVTTENMPYNLDFTKAYSPPSGDITSSFLMQSCSSGPKFIYDEKKSDFWNYLTLPVLFDRCIGLPLRAQMGLVNNALLDHFLTRLGLIKQFEFLQSRFFMQDGEFSQCLCNLLFNRFSRVTSPSDLLNPITLNSILSKAALYSHTPSSPGEVDADYLNSGSFDANLTFAVRFVPESFIQNSPSALDCLQLVYHVDFPVSIILCRSTLRYYERVFNFLLQLRYCTWATTDTYEILKMRDPGHEGVSPNAGQYDIRQYRFLQMYRHEMHHFLRCLLEHLNLHAFQATYLKLQEEITEVRGLDELITVHTKYLQKVSFRCLLHKKALPLRRILHKIFAIVVTFRYRLLSFTKALNGPHPHDAMSSKTTTGFSELQATYKEFKECSTFLCRVVTKLVRRGYQMPLQEFLTRLDFNGWYSNSGQCSSSLSSSISQ